MTESEKKEGDQEKRERKSKREGKGAGGEVNTRIGMLLCLKENSFL